MAAGAPPPYSIWPPPRRDRDFTILAVAAAVGIFGFFVGWLARRGWSPLGAPAANGGHGGNVTNIWNLPPGSNGLPHGAVLPPGASWAPHDVSGRALPIGDLHSSVNHDTRLNTVTLSDTTPRLIYSTPADRFYKLQVRVVNPPGSFITLSTDEGSLRNASVTGGNTLVIPVGSWNEVRLKPRQDLFAKGNVAGVTVTLVAAPEVSA